MLILGRGAAVVALGVVLLATLAGPALAHGRGSDATNFVSTVTEAPGLPGVSWQVYNGDEFLGVRNTSDTELVVLGYSGEPYLRIGPDGAFENQRSEAAYVNDDRYAAVEIPPQADPDAEPDWRQVSDEPAYAWHDHRIHWMSPELPPQVAPDPTQRVTVFPQGWEVPFTYGGERQVVRGELVWQPGPSPWPWLLGGLLVTLPALGGLRTRPVGETRWPGLARPAAVVLGLVTLLNVTNLVDDLLASPVPLSSQLVPAAQTLLFLAIAAFGAVRGWQGGDGAFTALGVGSGALLVGQGMLYLAVLSSSQSASVFPDWVTRAAVATSIAQAIPLGIVSVVGTRRLLPPLEPQPAEPDAVHA